MKVVINSLEEEGYLILYKEKYEDTVGYFNDLNIMKIEQSIIKIREENKYSNKVKPMTCSKDDALLENEMGTTHGFTPPVCQSS